MSNHTSAKHVPYDVGWMLSPGGFRRPPRGLPVVIDNGARGAHKHDTQWTPEPWHELLRAASCHCYPQWGVVPDVVGDRLATLAMYDTYYGPVRTHCQAVAFAVQDGMEIADVPASADVVFVGGSTAWKLATLRMWCAEFPRVHVARVNTWRRLIACYDAGAESVDGTGWWPQAAQRQLRRFFSAEIKQLRLAICEPENEAARPNTGGES